MNKVKISPILFAIAEALSYLGSKVFTDIPEGPLLVGVAAFLRVLTVYLIAKGVILSLGQKLKVL